MKNQNIFITGVSSGLGLALAKQFLDDGATVYGCSRRRPDSIADHPSMHFFELDLEDAENGPEKLRNAIADSNGFDLAILNAGMLGEIEPCLKQDLSDLRRIMEVNLWANHWIIQALLQISTRQIVAISSGAAVSAYQGWSGYNMSKAALNMFIAILAKENSNSHFVSLAPGLIDTAMQDHLASLPEDEKFGPVKRLREAKRSGAMPSPEAAASKIIKALPKLSSLESGAFADIREM